MFERENQEQILSRKLFTFFNTKIIVKKPTRNRFDFLGFPENPYVFLLLHALCNLVYFSISSQEQVTAIRFTTNTSSSLLDDVFSTDRENGFKTNDYNEKY